MVVIVGSTRIVIRVASVPPVPSSIMNIVGVTFYWVPSGISGVARSVRSTEARVAGELVERRREIDQDGGRP